MLELIIVSHTLIPINTDTYLSILYKDTVQMCISTIVSDIEKSHMPLQSSAEQLQFLNGKKCLLLELESVVCVRCTKYIRGGQIGIALFPAHPICQAQHLPNYHHRVQYQAPCHYQNIFCNLSFSWLSGGRQHYHHTIT